MKTDTKYTLEIRETTKTDCLTMSWWPLEVFGSSVPSSYSRGPEVKVPATKRRPKSTRVEQTECEKARVWWMHRLPNAFFRIVEVNTIETNSVFAFYSPILPRTSGVYR